MFIKAKLIVKDKRKIIFHVKKSIALKSGDFQIIRIVIITVIDKSIVAQMELWPNILVSIPGIGPVYSAGIMAEIGDINRFET